MSRPLFNLPPQQPNLKSSLLEIWRKIEINKTLTFKTLVVVLALWANARKLMSAVCWTRRTRGQRQEGEVKHWNASIAVQCSPQIRRICWKEDNFLFFFTTIRSAEDVDGNFLRPLQIAWRSQIVSLLLCWWWWSPMSDKLFFDSIRYQCFFLDTIHYRYDIRASKMTFF